MTITAGFAAGGYNIVVEINSGQAVAESDENNTVISSKLITML